jgi:membrane protein YdbS with pleckstrin-like domain
MRRTVLLVWAGVVLLGIVAATVVFSPAVWIPAAGGLLAVLLAGWGWVLIARNARSWGYAERDEDLYITHGVVFRELVAVPYGRMQFVDVTSGPVERHYGISTVHLHTASPKTNAKIPGLPAEEAARLRDRLTQLGEAQAAGL